MVQDVTRSLEHLPVDIGAVLQAQELDDLGRQPDGEIVVPLLDFHRPLLDSRRVLLGEAASTANAALQGA